MTSTARQPLFGTAMVSPSHFTSLPKSAWFIDAAQFWQIHDSYLDQLHSANCCDVPWHSYLWRRFGWLGLDLQGLLSQWISGRAWLSFAVSLSVCVQGPPCSIKAWGQVSELFQLRNLNWLSSLWLIEAQFCLTSLCNRCIHCSTAHRWYFEQSLNHTLWSDMNLQQAILSTFIQIALIASCMVNSWDICYLEDFFAGPYFSDSQADGLYWLHQTRFQWLQKFKLRLPTLTIVFCWN